MSANQILLGDVVPDFTLESQLGAINLYDCTKDHYVVLFSHPRDYTPVCTTELGEVAKLKSEWDKRNVTVLALSIATVESHKGWLPDIEQLMDCKVTFPMLADADRKVATLYSMVHPQVNTDFTVRTVYIIGPDKKLRAQLTYPYRSGRNFVELLRVIDSIQLTDKYPLATPANWQLGSDLIVDPSVSTEDAKKQFTKGVTETKSYFRTTPMPC